MSAFEFGTQKPLLTFIVFFISEGRNNDENPTALNEQLGATEFNTLIVCI